MENANFLTQIVFDEVTLGVLVLQSLTKGQIFRADRQANGVVLVLHLLLRQRVHPAVALLFTHRHPPSIGATAATREAIHKNLLLWVVVMLALASQSEFAARFERVRFAAVGLGRFRHSGRSRRRRLFVNGRHRRPIHFKRTSGTHC